MPPVIMHVHVVCMLMHSLSIRSKLYPPRDIRILSNVQSHTSLPPSGMEGHSWTAYFMKGVALGVYTAQPRLVCNSDVAVVVPQVPLVKLFTLQCGNKYTHPTHAASCLSRRAHELSLLPSANGVDLTYPTPLVEQHYSPAARPMLTHGHLAHKSQLLTSGSATGNNRLHADMSVHIVAKRNRAHPQTESSRFPHSSSVGL